MTIQKIMQQHQVLLNPFSIFIGFYLLYRLLQQLSSSSFAFLIFFLVHGSYTASLESSSHSLFSNIAQTHKFRFRENRLWYSCNNYVIHYEAQYTQKNIDTKKLQSSQKFQWTNLDNNPRMTLWLQQWLLEEQTKTNILKLYILRMKNIIVNSV